MHTPSWIPFTAVWAVLGVGLSLPAAESVPLVPEHAFPHARQPQAAVAPDGTVAVVFGSGNTVYVATSRTGGRSFDAPVKVGDAGVLALGMRRGPRVAVTATAVVVTAIGGVIGKGKDGDVLSWRSSDGGRTWQGPVAVNRVSGSAREGLHHMAASPDGTVFCVWNDLRAGRMQVYGTATSDGGATWQEEKLIYESPDGHICPCCQPAVAFDPRGGLHVMWRNDLQGDRDMYLCSSSDGGRTFGATVKLGRGNWRLKICPMDGGGLAGDGGGRVTTVWMRQKEIFRCVPGEAEESLGKGEQGWAAAGADGVYLAWIDGRPGVLKLLRPKSATPEVVARHAWDPVLAGPPDGKGPVVLVWEEGPPKAVRLRATTVLARP
jgi:hypothetical protein